MNGIVDAFLNAAKDRAYYIEVANKDTLSVPFTLTQNSVLKDKKISGYNFIENKNIILNLEDVVGFENQDDQKETILKKHVEKSNELIKKFNIETKNTNLYFYLNNTNKIKSMILFYEFNSKEDLYDNKQINYAKDIFLKRINAAINFHIKSIIEEQKNLDNNSSTFKDLETFKEILNATPEALNTNYNTPYDLAIYAWPLILAPNPFGIS
ncbi:MAG: hypothetical protein EBU90_29930 [Proteobacteria bacterium]|nr:hypothetical protein [Pseudomonadota bacterium]